MLGGAPTIFHLLLRRYGPLEGSVLCVDLPLLRSLGLVSRDMRVYFQAPSSKLTVFQMCYTRTYFHICQIVFEHSQEIGYFVTLE
jgi:hypothetical protein